MNKSIYIFFIFLLIILFPCFIFAQATKITISVNNVSLQQFLAEIEEKSNMHFSYIASNFDTIKNITVSVKDEEVEALLNRVLPAKGMRFVQTGNTIAILPVVSEQENKTPPVRQQGIRVTGSVSDGYGELLPGVAVLVLGSSVGATTDINGEFVITVPDASAVLEFSFLGFKTQEITVGNRRIIAVTLMEASAEISELTVVAFGTQKKESVVGSITTVNTKDLKTPTSNLTAALAGNMAGMIAYQRSGEPGADNADFFVRGITTFGTNTNPLILIDGIELTPEDLARLRPDDIASFSILKDATATALYGARGANGVILVTTKQGQEGPANISFRFENSFSMPTQTVKVADPITYMRLHNEAILTRDPLEFIEYSQEKIEMTEAGVFPLIYPANDWQKMLFKDFTMNQRANLSVGGGGNIARYYVSGSYNRDNGILNVDKRNNFNNNIAINNYNLRTNVSINISKTTELTARLSGNFEEYRGPLQGGTEMYNLMVHSNPVLFPAYYPIDADHEFVRHIMFGNYKNLKTNPYSEMIKGYKERSRSQILAQIELKQNLKFLTEGLSVRGMMNIGRLSQFAINRAYDPYFYEISIYNRLSGEYRLKQTLEGTEFLAYTELPDDRVQSSSFYFEGMANYARDFGKHAVSGLLVFMARQSLTANAGSLQLSLPSRSMGVSGRATYAYDRRYFAEFNFGCNGTERFDKRNRWGFFPSAGLAWAISNEKFWENIRPVASNLKLRYSYGLIGNDQIGKAEDRFFYLSQVNMNVKTRPGVFGQEFSTIYETISVDRYGNPSIKWETATKQNFALELGLWNKLTMIAEYFTEIRSNILQSRADISSTMGIADPGNLRANIGRAGSKGSDIQLEYQQSWSPDFWTSARANFTYAVSRYVRYEEPELERGLSLVGGSLSQKQGYIAERLFVDNDEAAGSPRQYIGNHAYGGGDIKYLDVNNDGKIDDNDKRAIGNPTVPEIIYGFGFSMGYKRFDFSAFFQGAGNQSFWINIDRTEPSKRDGTAPFVDDAQILKAYADSYWSEETQNLYAVWPRLSTFVHSNNSAPSTWFMRNATFLRLKQAEIGYSLPNRVTERIGISNLRFYVSGTNLFLLSKFKLWDVEMAGNGLGYPIQRVFNFGVNLNLN